MANKTARDEDEQRRQVGADLSRHYGSERGAEILAQRDRYKARQKKKKKQSYGGAVADHVNTIKGQ